MKAKLKVKEIEHLYTYNILDISKLRVFCFFFLFIIIDPRSKESLLNYSFSFSSDIFLIFQFSHEL